jgi:signal recognition particle subunit SRP14
MAPQLDESRFLTELGKLYERNKAKGSVWITMKSSNNKPRTKSGRVYPQEDYKCLIRAVAGKKEKKKVIATLVGADRMAKFQQAMIVIMKANMDALKKKEKTRKAA